MTAPARNWEGAPGCRRGARFLVDGETFRPTRDQAVPFGTRSECLQWIMAHRLELTRSLPGAQVKPVELARWMLGLV